MTDALLLHLAGPLQRWGASSAGGRIRDTHDHPTLSGVTGMIAAALGRSRDASNDDLRDLKLVVRIDDPGTRVRDFHTAGNGRPKDQTVITADGKRRGNGMVFEDWYLSGAAFTVALIGSDQTLSTVTKALAKPVFPPYLGRRSCPPAGHVVLWRTDDPEGELSSLPLHREKTYRGEVPVRFVYGGPPPGSSGPPSRLMDDGLDGSGGKISRPVWYVQRSFPGSLCAGFGNDWFSSVVEGRVK